MHSPGIEPGSYAWEAYILPLNHGCLVENIFSFLLSSNTTTKRIEFEFGIDGFIYLNFVFTVISELQKDVSNACFLIVSQMNNQKKARQIITKKRVCFKECVLLALL